MFLLCILIPFHWWHNYLTPCLLFLTKFQLFLREAKSKWLKIKQNSKSSTDPECAARLPAQLPCSDQWLLRPHGALVRPLMRVVLHGSCAWEEIQRWAANEQILNLPAMKCSNKRPGKVTHKVHRCFPSVFWKSWLPSRPLSALCIPHIGLSTLRQIWNTHCAHACVSSEGHVWKALTFQTAPLMTWLM